MVFSCARSFKVPILIKMFQNRCGQKSTNATSITNSINKYWKVVAMPSSSLQQNTASVFKFISCYLCLRENSKSVPSLSSRSHEFLKHGASRTTRISSPHCSVFRGYKSNVQETTYRLNGDVNEWLWISQISVDKNTDLFNSSLARDICDASRKSAIMYNPTKMFCSNKILLYYTN